MRNCRYGTKFHDLNLASVESGFSPFSFNVLAFVHNVLLYCKDDEPVAANWQKWEKIFTYLHHHGPSTDITPSIVNCCQCVIQNIRSNEKSCLSSDQSSSLVVGAKIVENIWARLRRLLRRSYTNVSCALRVDILPSRVAITPTQHKNSTRAKKRAPICVFFAWFTRFWQMTIFLLLQHFDKGGSSFCALYFNGPHSENVTIVWVLQRNTKWATQTHSKKTHRQKNHGLAFRAQKIVIPHLPRPKLQNPSPTRSNWKRTKRIAIARADFRRHNHFVTTRARIMPN